MLQIVSFCSCHGFIHLHTCAVFPTHPMDCFQALFIYLFGVLCRFQHCTGHITTGSWKGRGNQYIQFARVLYCKLPTNGKQLLAFPLKAMTGIEPRPQRWEARVLPLCHRGPSRHYQNYIKQSSQEKVMIYRTILYYIEELSWHHKVANRCIL